MYSLFALVLLATVSAQRPNARCTDDFGRARRCMPAFENAAFGKAVNSTNTCGIPPSEFCVQTGVTSPTEECQVCDASIQFYAHPALYITDIKDDTNRTWWQSETLLDNPEEKVTLTLDLGKTYDVSYVRIRFRSPRPESMAIYKRVGNDPSSPWEPYQYLSASCRNTYNVDPNAVVPLDDQRLALCSGEFSSISPLTGGNVAFATLNDRPSAYHFDTRGDLQEWVTASAIRIDLDRMNTFGDEVFGDPNVLRSYYFAIIDLAVGGRCKCNGHASSCETRQLSGAVWIQCNCEHYTAGIDCEKCLPLYNDREWKRSTDDSANECIKCNCSGLADSCEFDKDLNRGRCLNCKRNTAGQHCEHCKENFFRPTRVDDCQSCKCNPVGSLSLQCESSGQCVCKRGVTGLKCDRCRPEFFGFSETGCRTCECSIAGTDADNTQCNQKGECSCKRNVVGAKCSQCRQGFYALEMSNPHGCQQCFCYGHSTVCQAATSYTARNISSDFIAGLDGWSTVDDQGQDVTDQVAVHDSAGQYMSVTSVGNELIFAVAPNVFTGDRRSSYAQLFSFSFRVAASEGIQVDSEDVVLEGENGLKISTRLNSQGNPLPTSEFQKYVFRLHEDPSLGWEPLLTSFDFQRLLTSLKSIKVRLNYASQGTGMLDEVLLQSAVYDDSSPNQVKWVEDCSCPAPYRGDHCELCSDGYTRQQGSNDRYGQCVPCQCYGHSATCDPTTGVCNCIHKTTGDSCDKCIDGYYGNPTQGNPDDCRPCPCNFGSRCILIGSQVVCTDCPVGHTGNLCENCQDGYYGDPAGVLGNPSRCEKCNCSGNIDLNAIGNCDSQTGECLKCVYNTHNGPLDECELCSVGYYGNATDYPKPQCEACDCFPQGTVNPAGHDPRNPLPCGDQGSCNCLPFVIGNKCDSCVAEYWNVGSGRGCEQCECDAMGSLDNVCDVRSGQCSCKPGVTSRTCNQCKADHFAFSEQGCQSCDCNSEGSLNVSCNDHGVCICKPDVLGIKCDSCSENKHNLSVGCIACPPCYNEIQRLVTEVRTKVRLLIYFVRNYNDSSTNVVIDQDFAKRLETLAAGVNNLLDKAEHTNQTDKVLQKQIKDLGDRLEVVHHTLLGLFNATIATQRVVKDGVSSITDAELSLERSREALDKAEMLLATDGAKALNDSIIAANTTSEYAKRMQEMKKEAEELATKHEQDANRITEVALEVREKSREAVDLTGQAVSAQEGARIDIEELKKYLESVEQLQVRADGNATQSQSSSQQALDEANVLYANGTAPLPDLGITELQGKINRSKMEVAEADSQADTILTELRTLVDDFNSKEDNVRMKMAQWPGLLDKLKGLLENVTEANKTAHDAIMRGEETLKKALEMLGTLQKFNEIIEKSRKEAVKAESNIPEILRLIDSANMKSDSASVTLVDAGSSASEAEMTSNDAKDTAQRVQHNAEGIKTEANNLQIPIDNLTEPVNAASLRLDEFKGTAERQKKAVAKAKNTTNTAINASQAARNKIEEVLNKLKDLIDEINNLDTLDQAKLTELENRLDNETYTLVKVDRDIRDLETVHEKIKTRLTQYEVDLERLKKERLLVDKNYRSLPRVCPIQSKPGEGD